MLIGSKTSRRASWLAATGVSEADAAGDGDERFNNLVPAQ